MARIIPKRTLDDIRFRNDIVELIGSYINVKKAGSGFKALCPFHKEKTPSFIVNPQRQIFHCFGCGVGGDVFGFMMKYEGVDFLMAARMLAGKAGVTLDLEEGEHNAGDRAALYKIHEELARFYRRCLLQTAGAAVARDYLEKRDLSEEIAEDFLIGYAPKRWDAAIQWAAKHKYSREQLEKAGLIIRSDKDPGRTQFYDRFRNRLMFPIRDEQNRVIGFSGRALIEDEKTAKYVNSPETPLFRKSRVLYGLEKARRNIVETREAILCEGQIDVIRCHQAGLPTAVASQGTAFTEDHARILRRYADSIALVFDPDRAGQDAAVKAAVTFVEAGLAVRVATLPQGEDPDSFIRKEGADAFHAVLDKAASVVRFQIDVMSGREDTGSEVGVMRAARAVLQTISRSPNAVQRAKLVQEAAGCLSLPAGALQDDLQHVLRRQRNYQRGAPVPEQPATDAPSSATSHSDIPREERELCEHLVHADQEVAETMRKFLPVNMLTSGFCETMADACLRAVANGTDLHDIIHDIEDPTGAFKEFAAAVQMAPPKVTGREYSHLDAVKELILTIWRRDLKNKRAALGPADIRRHSQITYDLKALRNWEDGCAIIEIEMAQ